MLDDRPIEIGDDLVEFGKVYKVFKIEDKVTYGGALEKHIFFKPIYVTSDNHTLSCSVPLKMLREANIRRPITKKEMAKIIGALSGKDGLPKAQFLDINEAKTILKLNDPLESAKVLKSIWEEISTDELATKSRKDIYELSLKNLAQEVALAFNITPEKAEKKLTRALKRVKAK